ncbi:MAG: hypothetical protein V2I47_03865 [Bacteroidales bacterium]|jgi:hypothetical protein|nr:hypothetical protein [Bacteroidales bacterium]
MKTIAKALITTIIIFSIAAIAGERKARINLAVQSVSVVNLSNSEDAGHYHLTGPGSTEHSTWLTRKVASRKKTVSRPV